MVAGVGVGLAAVIPVVMIGARDVSVREEKGLRPGGFGLLMVRAQVDELLYNEKQNEVVFVKYLD